MPTIGSPSLSLSSGLPSLSTPTPSTLPTIGTVPSYTPSSLTTPVAPVTGFPSFLWSFSQTFLATLPSSTLTAVPPVAAGMPATPSYTSPGTYSAWIYYYFTFLFFPSFENYMFRLTSTFGANNSTVVTAVSQLAIDYVNLHHTVSWPFVIFDVFEGSGKINHFSGLSGTSSLSSLPPLNLPNLNLPSLNLPR